MKIIENRKYQVIYADPPWKYKSTTSPNQIGKYKSTKAKNNYESVSQKDLICVKEENQK